MHAFGVRETNGKSVMSSIIDANIIQSNISNRRTITVSIDLKNGASRTVDLTKCKFGQLDFKPDEVILKYIAYTTCENDAGNILPILTCDFLVDSDLLAPYNAQTSIKTYSNRYKVKQQIDIQNVSFTSKAINEDEQDIAFNTGTILVSLEFLRYRRRNVY